MNDLIKVTYDNDRATVSGRELHEKLEIKTPYTQWFERMAEYGFVENEDYIGLSQKCEKPSGGRPSVDHQMTIEMAKQICMIQRTDAGRRYREYFLEIERKWNDPQMVMARSLIYANKQLEILSGQLDAANARIEEANAQIEEAKPKVLFADAVKASKTSIMVGELAKLLRQNGVSIGQNRLFEWLRNNDYLMKSGESYNLPTQKSMERGLFEIKESTYVTPDNCVHVSKTTKITGAGQQYFVNLFLKDKAAG